MKLGDVHKLELKEIVKIAIFKLIIQIYSKLSKLLFTDNILQNLL